jgi:hypothetical protein
MREHLLFYFCCEIFHHKNLKVRGGRVEVGGGRRNDPNNVCTCEYINFKNLKITTKINYVPFLHKLK